MVRVQTKLAKLVVIEIIQWTAFASTVFVTAQKFGSIRPPDNRDYWIVIASSIGFVAGTTLVVWLPVKFVLQWKKIWRVFENQWSPSIALYFVLCAIPCVVLIVVGIPVGDGYQEYGFHTVCAELVVVMLMVIDISERLKSYKLRNDDEDEEEIPGIGNSRNTIRKKSGAYAMSSQRSSYIGGSRGKLFVWNDQRPSELFENFLAAYDVRLVFGMIYLSNQKVILEGKWYFGTYLVGLVSMASFVLTRHCKYKALADIIFLDLPFFCLRLAILCVFENVTHVLFLLKNMASIIIFIYFWAVRPNVFKKESSRQITVNTIDSSLPNGSNQQNHNAAYNQDDHEFDERSRADTFEYCHGDDGNHGYYRYEGDNYAPGDHVEECQHYNGQRQEEENEISVYYSLGDNRQYQQNALTNNERYDTENNDGNLEQHADVYKQQQAPVSPHQVKRISKKTFRKSIVKSNVFLPSSEQGDSQNVYDAKNDGHPSTSGYQASPKSLPPKSNAQNDHDTATLPLSADNDIFPPPPPEANREQFTRSFKYSVGPHSVSLRNKDFTPPLAAQIAHEVAEHYNHDDNESLDEQL